MERAGGVVEYLCLGCGAQGLLEDGRKVAEDAGDGTEQGLSCPRCGRRVLTISYQSKRRIAVPASI